MDGVQPVLLSSGLSSVFVMILYMTYKIFRHSRCKSNCCGKRVSFDIDLEEKLLKTNSATSIENEMDSSFKGIQ